MITKISDTLRNWLAVILVFLGLTIVIIGGITVKLGSWVNHTASLPGEAGDITDEQLDQLIKDARKKRGDK